jgi:hypothetical protein
MISQIINDKIGMEEIKQGGVHKVEAPFAATQPAMLPPATKSHSKHSNILLAADGGAAAAAAAATTATTATPTDAPTAAPTDALTAAPTDVPTAAPTAMPQTLTPTLALTATPQTPLPTQAPTPAPTAELVPGGDYTCCGLCETKGFVSAFRSAGAISGFSDVSVSLGTASTTDCSAINDASGRRLLALSTTWCTNQCSLWQSNLQWWLRKTIFVADNVAQEYAYALGTDGYTSKADIDTICPDDLIMR